MNRKEILIISVGIFLTIIAWLVIDIYNIENNSNIINNSAQAAEVARYKINKDIFAILKQKIP